MHYSLSESLLEAGPGAMKLHYSFILDPPPILVVSFSLASLTYIILHETNNFSNLAIRDFKTLESIKKHWPNMVARAMSELSAIGLQCDNAACTAARSKLIRKKEKQPSPIWVLQRRGFRR